MLGRDWKGWRKKGDFYFHNEERTVTISSDSSLSLSKGGALGKGYRRTDEVALQTEAVVQLG